MSDNRRGKTLEEHYATLKAEGGYETFIAQKRQRELELQAREAELALAEAPLIADLLAIGVSVISVWDLVNTSASYEQALPVLFAHLPRPYPVPIREGIARALAVSEAKYGWQTLVDRYRSEHDQRFKGGLAAAIAVLSDDKVIDDVIALARDSVHGPSRILLLEALARSHAPHAQAALTELAHDPELTVAVAQIARDRSRRRAKRRTPR